MAKDTLYSTYTQPGFIPQTELRKIAGKPDARIIVLNRRQKKRNARSADVPTAPFMTAPSGLSGTCQPELCKPTFWWRYAG